MKSVLLNTIKKMSIHSATKTHGKQKHASKNIHKRDHVNINARMNSNAKPWIFCKIDAVSYSLQLRSTQTETDRLKPTQCLNVEKYINYVGSTAAQARL